MSNGPVKYGLRFDAGTTDIDIELFCYAHDERPEGGPEGRLTKFRHFQNAVDLMWNNDRSSRRVVWNRWTNRMIQAMIDHRYVGLAGAGSSGKSDAVALFMLVEYLSFPTGTLCLLLSTTLIGAKKRVWKSVNEYWSALESQWKAEGKLPPGKMVNSKGMLVGIDVNGNWSEGTGLCLIAADKDNEKEAAKKLKGLKAPENGRLRLAADEFSDLGESVLTAMVGNLNTNPDFKGFGMANPGSKLTPFAKFVEPAAGWNSLSLGMEEWQTKYGVCLSFDALNSPRIMSPQHEVCISPDGTPDDQKVYQHKLYGWMPSASAIEQMKVAFGEDSMEWWAQVRGMFCPTGMENTVWSELELLSATPKVEHSEWDGASRPRIIALDPGFVTGGDRSPLIWAECGLVKGVKTMNIMGFRIASEVADTAEDGTPLGEDEKLTVSENIINQFIQLAKDHNVPPRRTGFDATGGGTVFGQWLRTKWKSQQVIGVRFGEKPVERRADSIEEADLIYVNRVTQLWVQPKAMVRQGQIRGIPMEVIEELCQRKWHATKNTGAKTCIEEKKDMKKRTGKSPDLADAFVILVEVAIQNGLLDVMEIKRSDREENQAWKRKVMDSAGMNLAAFQERKSLIAMPSAKRLKRA